MKTVEQIEAEIARLRAQIEAEIAALQAEREAARGPDLGEAVEEYRYGAEVPHAPYDNVHRGHIAAYPALHKVLGKGAPEPTEAEDLAMAQEVCRSLDYLNHITDVIVAAFKAERKRAGGVK